MNICRAFLKLLSLQRPPHPQPVRHSSNSSSQANRLPSLNNLLQGICSSRLRQLSSLGPQLAVLARPVVLVVVLAALGTWTSRLWPGRPLSRSFDSS